MSACNEMALDDCFRILKVREGAPWNAVKKSYHALATEFHPDRNPDDPFCENRFKKISLAFEYLEQHYIESPTDAIEKIEDLEGNSSMNSEADPISGLSAPDWKQFADYLAGRVWKFLRDSERMLLMLDVERTVNIDSKTATQGGSIRIKTPRESFYVTIPDGSADDFTLRIPGKGDAGILNRGRGDLNARSFRPKGRGKTGGCFGGTAGDDQLTYQFAPGESLCHDLAVGSGSPQDDDFHCVFMMSGFISPDPFRTNSQHDNPRKRLSILTSANPPCEALFRIEWLPPDCGRTGYRYTAWLKNPDQS